MALYIKNKIVFLQSVSDKVTKKQCHGQLTFPM